MKKYIFTLIAVLLFSSAAFGVASNRVYYHIEVVDQFGDTVTSPVITQIDVQNESGVAVAVYSTKSGTTEVGSTGVITSGLTDGRTEFWYADTAIDLTVTDGTRSYEIESYSVRDTRFMLPVFMPALAGNNLGQTSDLDFTYASWVLDGDTTNRLDHIPDNDGAVFAIGDGTTQADVYIYSNSTSDYWLFDEGAGEVYYENLDLQFGDQDNLYFGADNDASIMFDETTDDNLEIAAGSVGMSITTNDLLISLDTVGADQFKVNAQGQIDGDAINLETTDGGIMLNADGSSYGDIEANAADDIIVTAADDLDIDAADNITVDTADGSVTVTIAGSANGDLTFSIADDFASTVAGHVVETITGSTTYRSDGISITSSGTTVGDYTIVVDDDYSNTVGGSYTVTSKGNGIQSIYLRENAGTSGAIKIHADQGTGSNSIELDSDAGAINIHADAGALTLTATGGTAGDMTLSVGDDYANTVAGDYTLTVTGSSTLGTVMFRRNTKVITASATQIPAAWSGCIIVSTTGLGSQTCTLPTAALGLQFTFVDISAVATNDLEIIANTGDTICGGNAAGSYISGSDTVPACVTLTAVSSTAWTAIEQYAHWHHKQ